MSLSSEHLAGNGSEIAHDPRAFLGGIASGEAEGGARARAQAAFSRGLGRGQSRPDDCAMDCRDQRGANRAATFAFVRSASISR